MADDGKLDSVASRSSLPANPTFGMFSEMAIWPHSAANAQGWTGNTAAPRYRVNRYGRDVEAGTPRLWVRRKYVTLVWTEALVH